MSTRSWFYLIVKAKKTHSFDEVDTLNDVDLKDDVENELEVKKQNERFSFLAKLKTHPNQNWIMLRYLDEVETLDEVDIDDDVDTELEVDTLKINVNCYFKTTWYRK